MYCLRSNAVNLLYVTCFILSLILLNLNLQSKTLVFRSNLQSVIYELNCSDIAGFISEKRVEPSVTFIGERIVHNVKVAMYRVNSVFGREVNVKVYYTNGNFREITVVFMINDYTSPYERLSWLAENLAKNGFIAVNLENPHIIDGKVLKLYNKNVAESWIALSIKNLYDSLTIIHNLIPTNTSKVKVTVLGVGFGGVVATLSTYYIESIDSAVSIGNVFGFEEALSRGSILTHYVEDINDINPCLNPSRVVRNVNKRILVVMGLFDEVSNYNCIEDYVLTNPAIRISVIPNKGRFIEIPEYWLNVIYGFLKNQTFTGVVSKEAVVKETPFYLRLQLMNVSNNNFILHRPLLPGFQWLSNDVENGEIKLIYLLVPYEVIVLDRDTFVIQRIYVVDNNYGLIISILSSIAFGYLTFRKNKAYLKRPLTVVLITSLITLLFMPIMPSFLVPGFYHISIVEAVDQLCCFIPILPYLTLVYTAIQSLLLVISMSSSFRAKMYYVAIALFYFTTMYSSVTFASMLFPLRKTIYPTIPIALIAVASLILTLEFRSSKTR